MCGGPSVAPAVFRPTGRPVQRTPSATVAVRSYRMREPLPPPASGTEILPCAGLGRSGVPVTSDTTTAAPQNRGGRSLSVPRLEAVTGIEPV